MVTKSPIVQQLHCITALVPGKISFTQNTVNMAPSPYEFVTNTPLYDPPHNHKKPCVEQGFLREEEKKGGQ
jgi:hypothetical protein